MSVPNVQHPFAFPNCVQAFQVRLGSSTTPKLVISTQFCLMESSNVGRAAGAVASAAVAETAALRAPVVPKGIKEDEETAGALRSSESALVSPEMDTG